MINDHGTRGPSRDETGRAITEARVEKVLRRSRHGATVSDRRKATECEHPPFGTVRSGPTTTQCQRVQSLCFPAAPSPIIGGMAQDCGHRWNGVTIDFGPSGLRSAADPWSDATTGATSCLATSEDTVGTLCERWRRLDELHHLVPWPTGESHGVAVAVLAAIRNGPEAMLHDAGQRWGEAHRDTETFAERIEVLRQIMVEERHEDSDAVHKALDGVVASAAMALCRRLEIDSRTDVLTGVGNRRAFDESLGAAIASASRQHYSFSLVIVDIDAMKEINDSEGHQAGDDALVRLAHALDTLLRREDHVYRIGGDEFAIIMPYCVVGATTDLMERVRGGGAPSFSWGVSSFPTEGVVPTSLVAAADASMYRRKSRLDRRSSKRAACVGTGQKVRIA